MSSEEKKRNNLEINNYHRRCRQNNYRQGLLHIITCYTFFQSHTCTHRNLKLLDSTEARLELSDSRKIIEDTLRKPVLHLAYPYGKYTINVMKIAEETGYQLAYAAGYSYLNDQFSRARFDTLNLTIKFPYLFPIVTNGWGDVAREFWGLLRLWTKTTSKKQYLL